MKAYCISGDAIPVSIDNLKFAIEHTYNVKIETRMVPLGSKLIRGMIEVYEGESIVYIDDKLNLAWSRYVFAKEACHHLLKGTEYYTDDPIGVIEDILLDVSVEDGSSTPGLDVQSEELTKYAVIELLFPMDFRDSCKNEINANNTSIYDIAARFEIPMHLVEIALTDVYMEFAKKVWGEISA